MKTRRERQIAKAELVQRLADQYIAVVQQLQLFIVRTTQTGDMASEETKAELLRLNTQALRLSIRIYRGRADMIELGLPMTIDGDVPDTMPEGDL